MTGSTSTSGGLRKSLGGLVKGGVGGAIADAAINAVTRAIRGASHRPGSMT